MAAAAWRRWRKWQVAAVCGNGGGNGGSDGSLAAAAEVLWHQLGMVVEAAAAAWQQQLGGIGRARDVCGGDGGTTAQWRWWRWQQQLCSGSGSLATPGKRGSGDSGGSMAVAASALVAAAVVQCNSAVVVVAAAPAPAISCCQGEFNNQQRWEAAMEGLVWAQMGGQ
jgi:hypothetical protein